MCVCVIVCVCVSISALEIVSEQVLFIFVRTYGLILLSDLPSIEMSVTTTSFFFFRQGPLNQ